MKVRHRIRDRLLQDLDWQEMQFAMPHSPGSNDQIGEIFYTFDRTPQDNHLKTVIMIHMHVHGG